MNKEFHLDIKVIPAIVVIVLGFALWSAKITTGSSIFSTAFMYPTIESQARYINKMSNNVKVAGYAVKTAIAVKETIATNSNVLSAIIANKNTLNLNRTDNDTYSVQGDDGEYATNTTTANLPDLTIDSITLNAATVQVDETVKVTVLGSNLGPESLTSLTGIGNGSSEFQDFIIADGLLPTLSPEPSISDPLEAGDTYTYTYIGRFSSNGEKTLRFTIDNTNELEEVDETNNATSTQVTIGNPADIKPELSVKQIQNRTDGLDEQLRSPVVRDKELALQIQVASNGTASALDGVLVHFYVDSQLESWQVTPGVLGGGGSTETPTFKWTPTKGEHILKVIVDPNDTIDELNEENNEYTETLIVHDENLAIAEFNITDITKSSAKLYWRAQNAGSVGEYRYGLNSDLSNTTWITDGISDGTATGNIFGSKVTLTGLNSLTNYFVEVRKWFTSGNERVYGDSAKSNFTTLAGDASLNCPGYPYHVATSDGRCVWSCSLGTTPSNVSPFECVCQDGLIETGTDDFGRRICTDSGNDSIVDSKKVSVCHFNQGRRGYTELNISRNAWENGHRGHSRDFLKTSSTCEIVVGTPTVPDRPTDGPNEPRTIDDSKDSLIESLKARIRELNIKISEIEKRIVNREKAAFKGISQSLINSFNNRQRLLIQPESLGEVYLWNPDIESRVFIHEKNAFQVLKSFAVGITKADMEKCSINIDERVDDKDTDGDGLSDRLEDFFKTDPNNPDTDGDGFNDGVEVKADYDPLTAGRLPVDSNFCRLHEGKFFLVVEGDGAKGQAFHIKNGKATYMSDQASAYNVMRFNSDGMFNRDLELLPITDLSEQAN